MLKESLDLVPIGVGDIFRWHIQSHTKLGARIKRTMAEGQLVSDELVEEVVKQRLDQHDWNQLCGSLSAWQPEKPPANSMK